MDAASLSPCLAAAGNLRAKILLACFTMVNALIGTAAESLWAVLLWKQAGIKPGIAISIPERCNISSRARWQEMRKITLFHEEADDIILI